MSFFVKAVQLCARKTSGPALRSLSSAPGGRATALLQELSSLSKFPQSHQLDSPAAQAATVPPEPELIEKCGDVEEEVVEMEEMFCTAAAGLEWGGPRRGGRFAEPTRFGDWEQKGRCTDF
mmetsp:Transcript_48612/g.110322  ORF Transcript_48612/g.110322 Transcript_48612/m.110322 type:complete len:121 (+) Transcript_48612:234-596(+)|eukprot:CAMPEP_0172585726 /NCGR_PEP_ID=MMETSP1068-20121228/5119_1 /TAXON_ID=35684 /ORGANISM="Pseudopedinella elastica, Strain CCMP716" /LENGTH=120 /DNA_ID=CAMNT_0013380283 /DNA_START=186 /DNA_END=548 /DNA_ORIENTATION=+